MAWLPTTVRAKHFRNCGFGCLQISKRRGSLDKRLRSQACAQLLLGTANVFQNRVPTQAAPGLDFMLQQTDSSGSNGGHTRGTE